MRRIRRLLLVAVCMSYLGRYHTVFDTAFLLVHDGLTDPRLTLHRRYANDMHHHRMHRTQAHR
jgi:hypothetical protein